MEKPKRKNSDLPPTPLTDLSAQTWFSAMFISFSLGLGIGFLIEISKYAEYGDFEPPAILMWGFVGMSIALLICIVSQIFKELM